MAKSTDRDFEIRSAGAEDEERVMALLQQLGEGRYPVSDAVLGAFRTLLDGVRGAVLVADDGGKAAGMISFSFNLAMRYGGEYAQIEELIVDEAYRGYGLGAMLVEGAIAAAKGQGCGEIGLYALDHNRAFYEKFGFEYEGLELRQSLSV